MLESLSLNHSYTKTLRPKMTSMDSYSNELSCSLTPVRHETKPAAGLASKMLASKMLEKLHRRRPRPSTRRRHGGLRERSVQQEHVDLEVHEVREDEDR